MYSFTCFCLSSPPEGKQEETRDPGIVHKRYSVNNCWRLNEYIVHSSIEVRGKTEDKFVAVKETATILYNYSITHLRSTCLLPKDLNAIRESNIP